MELHTSTTYNRIKQIYILIHDITLNNLIEQPHRTEHRLIMITRSRSRSRIESTTEETIDPLYLYLSFYSVQLSTRLRYVYVRINQRLTYVTQPATFVNQHQQATFAEV